VWALDLLQNQLTTIYDAALAGSTPPLEDPDNVTVHEPTGHLYVGEDAGQLRLTLLARGRSGWTAAPFLQLVGHDGSEVTGPSFTPDSRRLYVTSQRGTDGDGLVFEVTGRFAART
jgi:secreted PhoX family phosphatase